MFLSILVLFAPLDLRDSTPICPQVTPARPHSSTRRVRYSLNDLSATRYHPAPPFGNLDIMAHACVLSACDYMYPLSTRVNDSLRSSSMTFELTPSSIKI